jgi:type IV fimbrial biogenesis protein FimT
MPFASAPRPTPPAYAHAPIDGFTSIELMVTVAIVGVLAALAAPSFQTLMERWRVRQVVSDLESSLQFARSEAIKRNGGVVMQKITTNSHGCSAPTLKREWDCGWFICADTNRNKSCASSEPVLLRYDSPGHVHVTRTGGDHRINFNRHGLVDGTYLGFNLVPRDQSVSHPATHGLCMTSGGSIRIRSGKVTCK